MPKTRHLNCRPWRNHHAVSAKCEGGEAGEIKEEDERREEGRGARSLSKQDAAGEQRIRPLSDEVSGAEVSTVGELMDSDIPESVT